MKEPQTYTALNVRVMYSENCIIRIFFYLLGNPNSSVNTKLKKEFTGNFRPKIARKVFIMQLHIHMYISVFRIRSGSERIQIPPDP